MRRIRTFASAKKIEDRWHLQLRWRILLSQALDSRPTSTAIVLALIRSESDLNKGSWSYNGSFPAQWHSSPS